MATTCDMCGYRNSELKPGGEIPAKGKKITLRVQNAQDLTRDVIKVWMFPVYSNLHACA
ncbi:ZPR1 zinc-finger domain protein [Zea mays]|uniref:ZPR1 zinc-finger domain protein n=1 Tax=Zea mays TaxID=4577 RepID=A0A1D6L5J4_MAIZE|nr:ZPR1 zinc-finger domain protein [Zea mays]